MIRVVADARHSDGSGVSWRLYDDGCVPCNTAPGNCTASLSAVRLGGGPVKARRAIPELFR